MDARKVLQQGRMPLAIVGQGELSAVLWPENATFLSALTGTPDPPHPPQSPSLPTPPASPESPSLTETLLSEAEIERLLEKVEREWPQSPGDVGGALLLAGDRRRASQFKAVALVGFLAGFVCCLVCLLILRGA